MYFEESQKQINPLMDLHAQLWISTIQLWKSMIPLWINRGGQVSSAWVEESGLNPGLNRPGRNRFLPPEMEETGKNWKRDWNARLSQYFPLQEPVILKTNETPAKNVLNINTLLLFTYSFQMGSETRNCDGFLEEIIFFHLEWKKLG